MQRVKCLLVDDLEENILAFSAVLQSDAVEVLAARSGAEALELLLVHEVALAIVDVQMPEMDGFELAELMRGSERTRRVPIIFVTAGNWDQQRVFKGYDAGAVDFLYKPLDARILRNKAGVFFQLYRQQQQLAHELRERTETLRLHEIFSAVLGHDLRTPLSVILTSAELVQRVAGEEPVRQAAARMLSSGRRMSRMVSDLLDLARSRLGGGIPLQREPTDLEPLVHRLVSEHQAALPGASIDVTVVGDVRGEWDPHRLAQAIANLLGNALQHGAADEAVGVRLDGGDAEIVRVCVSNAGRIAPENVQHLFDPFRGQARAPHRDQGLGLGLYIVDQIAKAHGGRIELVDDDAPRTTFRLSMPRSA
jgi:signal transduction histidine kinase